MQSNMIYFIFLGNIRSCSCGAEEPETPDLKPDSIMTDFETVAFKAFMKVFPGTHNQGCSFHMKQAIYRKVQMLLDKST